MAFGDLNYLRLAERYASAEQELVRAGRELELEANSENPIMIKTRAIEYANAKQQLVNIADELRAYVGESDEGDDTPMAASYEVRVLNESAMSADLEIRYNDGFSNAKVAVVTVTQEVGGARHNVLITDKNDLVVAEVKVNPE